MKKNKKRIIICIIVMLIALLSILLFKYNSIKDGYLYQSNHDKATIGKKAIFLRETFDSYEKLIKKTKNETFIRHEIKNGKIVSMDVGFKYNGKVYYLKGADYGDSYLDNINTLNKVFGKKNCEGEGDTYSCYSASGDATVGVSSTGNVSASMDSDWGCSISEVATCYSEYEDE